MGAVDCERQKPNVFRMRLMGAEVIPVQAQVRPEGICNEAMRDWTANYKDTHYILGTAAGPHPFPTIVREFQRMIGEEAKEQILKAEAAVCRMRRSLCRWRFKCNWHVRNFHRRRRCSSDRR